MNGSMLDNQNYIRTHDPDDSLGVVAAQLQQLQQEAGSLDLNPPQQIVFVGMGGSALGALLTQTWPGYSLPFEIVRDYDLPAYVSGETLVILASHSGNTEEVISAFHRAKELKSQMVVIAGGGQLKQLAIDHKIVFVELAQTTQPRYATLGLFKALVAVLQAIGQVDGSALSTELDTAAEFLKQEIANWLPSVPSSNNLAKQLAQAVIGRTPVIYAGRLMAPAAYKWKISFNENAKNVAWWGQYPEFNHNEFIGWSSHPVEKPYAVIDLRSSFEHQQVGKRFELSDRLLSGQRPKAHVVKVRGETILTQLLWATILGDFVSIYVALLNGVNPTPVDLVEKLKHELKPAQAS